MLELLKTVSLFNKLNDIQLSIINGVCRKSTYPAGKLLFREKDQGDAFYIILSGSVKIFTSSPSGEEKILTILRSGDSFGEMSLIDGKPRSASAATLEDSTLMALATRDFLDLLRKNFDITLAIMQELAQRLRDTNQQVNDLVFLDARTRIIKNLLLIANKSGKREGHLLNIPMPLNMQELARLAGVTEDDLKKVIRDLQDKRLLLFSDQGFILDLSKLRS
jgi:CRP/FNR family transcriptional regulator/CRP/FNR family cyclic AMP-dependent transcriptional regulator